MTQRVDLTTQVFRRMLEGVLHHPAVGIQAGQRQGRVFFVKEKAMAQVIGVVLTAGAYHRGVHCPGWSTIRLDDVTQLIIPGENGMLVPLDEAERRGHDANRMRERLEEWERTGKLPAHNPADPSGEVTFELVAGH